MDKTKYIKILIGVILITSLGTSIGLVESNSNRATLSTSKYVLDVSKSGEGIDVNEDITINNKYSFTPSPLVTVGGSKIVLTPPGEEATKIEEETGSYSVSMGGEGGNAKIGQDISIYEDKIILHTTITNQGAQEKVVNIKYNVKGTENTKVFYPSKVENGTNQYTVLTNEDKKGLSLGVTSNINQTTETGEEAFQKKKRHSVDMFGKIPGEGSTTLHVVLTPINIWNSEHDLEFNPKFSNYLENPLVDPKGSVNLSIESGGQDEKITGILSQLKESKTMGEGEFQQIKQATISGNNLNSLEASLAFKETCIKEKVPCKLIIGQKGEEKYSWIKAREENGWKAIDAHKGTEGEPTGYNKIYEEPQPKYVEVKGNLVQDINYVEATKFLLSTGGAPVLLYFAVIASTMISLFVMLSWKSEWIINSLGAPSGEEIKRVPINGKYKILSEEEDIDKQSVKTIFEKLKEEEGEVEVQRYSEESKYSEEFIGHCVRYLRDGGHIEREETEEKIKAPEIEEEEEVEKDKETSEGLESKIGLTPLQLILILAVVIGGAAALVIILMI